MLIELSKKDSKWRGFALSICKDKLLADDLVQDMYIYFSDKDKQATDYYVCRKIYGLFIDYIRKQKEDISIEYLFYLKDDNKVFEPNDEEQIVLDAFNELSFVPSELMLEHYVSEKSLRDIQKDFPLINYGYAYRKIKEAKEYIKLKTNGKAEDRQKN